MLFRSYDALLGWKPGVDEGSLNQCQIGDVGDVLIRGGNALDPNFGRGRAGADGTPAQRALAGLEARREGEVATAVMQSNKSGDDGISRLHATEIPLYVRIPHGYTGHAFFHADTVLLDAGTLRGGAPVRNLEFGKIPALGNAGLGNIGQTDKGVALAAGYEYNGAYNSWREIGRAHV